MYRAADVCVVSSLHDGMNLVAKEFIAARNDEHGVLVLSRVHRRRARARAGGARQSVRGRRVRRCAASARCRCRRRSAPPHARAARARRLAHRVRLGERAAAGGLPDGAGALTVPEPLPLHHGVDRQRPRARAGRSRHQHRLAVPAALRQSVGVRAAARPGARRHVVVQAGRGLARDRRLRAQHQRAAHRGRDGRRPLRDLRLRAADACRASRSMRRSRSAGCCGRSPARRACACTSIRGPTTRAPASKSSRRAPASKCVGGPTRLYLRTNVPAPYMQDGSPIRIDRPIVLRR